MFEKVEAIIKTITKGIFIGAGIYFLIACGSYANFQRGVDVELAKTTVERAEASIKEAQLKVNGIVARVDEMSRELIKLNNDKTTQIVLSYMQPK